MYNASKWGWIACSAGVACLGAVISSLGAELHPAESCTLVIDYLDDDGFSIVVEVESHEGDHSAIFSWGGMPPFALAINGGVMAIDPDHGDTIQLAKTKVDFMFSVDAFNKMNLYLSTKPAPETLQQAESAADAGSRLMPDLEAIVNRAIELSPQRENDLINDTTILRGGPVEGEIAWGRERSCWASRVAGARFRHGITQLTFSSILRGQHAERTRRLWGRPDIYRLPMRLVPLSTTLHLGEPYIQKVFPINAREAFRNSQGGPKEWNEGTCTLHRVSILSLEESKVAQESERLLKNALRATRGGSARGGEVKDALAAARAGVRKWASCQRGSGPELRQTIRVFPGVDACTRRAYCESRVGRLEIGQWFKIVYEIAIEPLISPNHRAEAIDLLAMSGGFGWGTPARTMLDAIPIDSNEVRVAQASAAVHARCAEESDLNVLTVACKDTSAKIVRRRTTLKAALLTESGLAEAEQLTKVLLESEKSDMEDEHYSQKELNFAASATPVGREGIVAALTCRTKQEDWRLLELLLAYYETVSIPERISDPTFCKLCRHAKCKVLEYRDRIELASTPGANLWKRSPSEQSLPLFVPDWAAIASLGSRDDEFNKQFVRMALVSDTKAKGIWYSALKNYILADGMLTDHLAEVEVVYDKIPKDYVISLARHLKMQAQAGEIATKDREAVLRFASRALQDADPYICSAAKAIRESLRYADSASE